MKDVIESFNISWQTALTLLFLDLCISPLGNDYDVPHF